MHERWPLEAVVFDAGGTLVRLDFEWMSELLESFGMRVTATALRRAEVAGRRRYDGSPSLPAVEGESPPLGTVGDTRAYFGGMLEAAGVPAKATPPILDRFAERHAKCGLWTRPVEGARVMLDQIAAMGVRRAVVSNSDGRAEMHLIDCGVREGLEFVVDSHLVGVEKPAARIFEIALQRLDVPAERALYVGDIVAVDVNGARAAGMNVVLIDPYRDYAPRGVMQIPHIGALPAWIADHCVARRTERFARESQPLQGVVI